MKRNANYLDKALGFSNQDSLEQRKTLKKTIALKLAFKGLTTQESDDPDSLLKSVSGILLNYQEKERLLHDHLCPVDQRIQKFLNRYLKDLGLEKTPSLPSDTLILDQHGLARELSVPREGDHFESSIVKSYRINQGILNNPKNDRRTTKGVFHIVEGGLPVPADKKVVPKNVYARLLEQSLKAPSSLLELPFSSCDKEKVLTMVSLMLMPTVCPEIPGYQSEKKMEIRFFAPGNLVSNLDFVESIFANAGDPELPKNDLALDPDHWTGHTGCVILAPHLTKLRKKDLGLPRKSDASERQVKDGMYWEEDSELYNDGQAFKVTCRDGSGVIVTLIADNYYGYCKKEVKTQIGYSANLFGLAEEEHSGGALVFPSYHLGYHFDHPSKKHPDHTFERLSKLFKTDIEFKDEGYGIDKKYNNLIYVPENAMFDVNKQVVEWSSKDGMHSIKLSPKNVYMLPTGYKISMRKHPGAPSWRLEGTEPEGTLCHKPCTVSGGGKSEISKAFSDSYIYGPFFVNNLEQDFKTVDSIFDKDFGDRFKIKLEKKDVSRKILNENRSLGSTIKLLTTSPEYTDDFNQWLEGIPSEILSLIFIIKRFYRMEWGQDWKSHFGVDFVNGSPGHELRFDGRRVTAVYARVGFDKNGTWRTFKLRQDFVASKKLQLEDDITASVVIPESLLKHKNPDYSQKSFKLIHNCEYRLFQRPDDAKHRGYDRQAEKDLSEENTFISNFEPMTPIHAGKILDDIIEFNKYTPSMKALIEKVSANKSGYFIASDKPRMVNGAPSQNPRYLQNRQDLTDPFSFYVADQGVRLQRGIVQGQPVVHPVNAVLPGHKNNPPQPGIKPLSVYGPIHYLDLPELFMDFICSLTGKSPSTTGAGSEGALTKAPFNALQATVDLNNALVSLILTGNKAFITSAGHIGPDTQVDHDISLLMPELWSRIAPQDRDPEKMIEDGFLEALKDFEHKGKKVLASRLGYRITKNFVHTFLGKIFDNPSVVLPIEILQPEIQDQQAFVDGIENIVDAQKSVALNYFADGAYENACPPIKALLSIMAHGDYEGKTVDDIRGLFSREALIKSSWYQKRLDLFAEKEAERWASHINYLESFMQNSQNKDLVNELNITQRLASAKEKLTQVKSEDYRLSLVGTIGLDPIHGYQY